MKIIQISQINRGICPQKTNNPKTFKRTKIGHPGDVELMDNGENKEEVEVAGFSEMMESVRGKNHAHLELIFQSVDLKMCLTLNLTHIYIYLYVAPESQPKDGKKGDLQSRKYGRLV